MTPTTMAYGNEDENNESLTSSDTGQSVDTGLSGGFPEDDGSLAAAGESTARVRNEYDTGLDASGETGSTETGFRDDTLGSGSIHEGSDPGFGDGGTLTDAGSGTSEPLAGTDPDLATGREGSGFLHDDDSTERPGTGWQSGSGNDREEGGGLMDKAKEKFQEVKEGFQK